MYQLSAKVFLFLRGITAGVLSLFVKYVTTRLRDGSTAASVPVNESSVRDYCELCAVVAV